MEVNSKNSKQPQEQRLGWLKNGNSPCDLWSLPKCRATAKHSGQRCKKPAMKGRAVCYIHGGKSPGAPKGNNNAYKHGLRSRAKIEQRKRVRQIIKEAEDLFNGVD